MTAYIDALGDPVHLPARMPVGTDRVLADGEAQHDTDYADYARDEADAARYPDRDYDAEEQARIDEQEDRDRCRSR